MSRVRRRDLFRAALPAMLSARNRSVPVDIPGFTRGGWRTRKPLPLRGAAA